MTKRKSAKEIFPVLSLSTSPIILLISSFFGSNPSALIATCRGVDKVGHKNNIRRGCNQFLDLTRVDCLMRVWALFFTLSSLTSMNPEPSVSNSSKASLISCFSSSVSSGLGLVFLRGGGTGPCREGLFAVVAWWEHKRGEKRMRNRAISEQIWIRKRANYQNAFHRFICIVNDVVIICGSHVAHTVTQSFRFHC